MYSNFRFFCLHYDFLISFFKCLFFHRCCRCVEEEHCEWDRNGLGYDYQVMAGPTFIAVYTIVGVFFGVAADRFNR